MAASNTPGRFSSVTARSISTKACWAAHTDTCGGGQEFEQAYDCGNIEESRERETEKESGPRCTHPLVIAVYRGDVTLGCVDGQRIGSRSVFASRSRTASPRMSCWRRLGSPKRAVAICLSMRRCPRVASRGCSANGPYRPRPTKNAEPHRFPSDAARGCCSRRSARRHTLAPDSRHCQRYARSAVSGRSNQPRAKCSPSTTSQSALPPKRIGDPQPRAMP